MAKGIALILGATIFILRPLLGPAVCQFHPSCTRYALEQLQQEALFIALRNICARLIRCSPLHRLVSS